MTGTNKKNNDGNGNNRINIEERMNFILEFFWG
jgi:hypothetical protein